MILSGRVRVYVRVRHRGGGENSMCVCGGHMTLCVCVHLPVFAPQTSILGVACPPEQSQ